MKVLKKFISVVGLTSSLLMGGGSVQGGNTFSFIGSVFSLIKTQPQQGLGRVVKLEPFYLVCVLNHLETPAGDSELKTLQNFEQVSKNAAEAMKMIKRFDFNSDYYINIDNDYNKITQNIVKLCPNIETVRCSRHQLRFEFFRTRPEVVNVIPVLKDNGVKCLEVWSNHPESSDSLDNIEDHLPSREVDFSGMTIDYHGHLIWDLKDPMYYLNPVIRCLENLNITLVDCIYVKSSEGDSPFLDEIQRHYSNVKIFEWDDYFRKFGENINDRNRGPFCMFYIKYKIYK